MRLTEAYMAMGITNEAQTAAAVLGHNFPDSPWYKDAYALLQSGAWAALQDSPRSRSWLDAAERFAAVAVAAEDAVDGVEEVGADHADFVDDEEVHAADEGELDDGRARRADHAAPVAGGEPLDEGLGAGE